MIERMAVRQRRVLSATRERVWDAWTRPELMMKWFCPLGMSTTRAEADVRVGGHYRVAMKPGPSAPPPPPQFGDLLVAEGVYEQVIPSSLLVFTWSWVGQAELSRVRVVLEEHRRGTELLLIHERLTDADSLAFHEAGWVATLDNLVAHLAGQIA